ncbi:HupE/UreJ family protein [Arcobacter sp. YIC-464]|uniref:HupE/UreJ family protein n=1 Tax=Arcobacter sp. YIC-464 TaxID=3376631 RepID=UPI003C1B9088
MDKKVFNLFLLLFVLTMELFAHGMSDEEKQIIIDGGNFSYIYIGMTHMLSGYDHLLFIFGILFFIKSIKEIIKLITLFTIGHSVTLISATFYEVQINYYLIDAIIALSICYIAFVNLGFLDSILKTRFFNMNIMVLIFGLIHGLGLSTRLQQMPLNENELLLNILSFNIGIELGQIIALIVMFLLLQFIYKTIYFNTIKKVVNIILIFLGFILAIMQFMDYKKSLSETNSEEFKDIITISIPAKGEKEYKLWVLKNQKFSYEWQSNEKLYFDFHGEPSTAVNGYFESYKEKTSSNDEGLLKAKFIGTHGWYWRNDTLNNVTIILKLNGEYKLMHK